MTLQLPNSKIAMHNFAPISPAEATHLMKTQDANVVDIRDENSYLEGHVDGALHLDNATIASFISETDHSQPLIVYCYHGISSQSAAAYFAESGFTSVFSVDGGYEAWKNEI